MRGPTGSALSIAWRQDKARNRRGHFARGVCGPFPMPLCVPTYSQRALTSRKRGGRRR
jgi:hypothetical protein